MQVVRLKFLRVTESPFNSLLRKKDKKNCILQLTKDMRGYL